MLRDAFEYNQAFEEELEREVAASIRAECALHITQQAKPKITPQCGTCHWFVSRTCEFCKDHSQYVEDPA